MNNKKMHYAWVIMVACFFILMMLMGVVLATTTVFLKPVSEALELSRTRFTSYTLLSGIAGMLASMLAGRIINKLGIKKTVVVGAAIVGAAHIGYSVSNAMWHFWVFGAMSGFGAGFSASIVCNVLLNNWFKERKAFATSIAFMGTSTGTLVFSRIATALLNSVGWRTAYAIIGVAIFVITAVIAIFFVVETPDKKGLVPYGETGEVEAASSEQLIGITQMEFLKTPSFYMLAISFALTGIVILGVQNHLLAFLSDLGYSESLSNNVYTVLLVVQMGGKILLGILLDKFGLKFGTIYTLITYLICTIGFLLAANPAFAFMGAVGLGLAAGICTIIPPVLTSAIVGKKDFANIFGSLFLFSSIGNSVCTMTTSILYDSFGGYSTAWVVYAVGMVIITVCFFMALKFGKKLTWK